MIKNNMEKTKEEQLSIFRKKEAIKLRKKGFSLREIAKEIGLNHPQKVSNLLKDYNFVKIKKLEWNRDYNLNGGQKIYDKINEIIRLLNKE